MNDKLVVKELRRIADAIEKKDAELRRYEEETVRSSRRYNAQTEVKLTISFPPDSK